MSRPSSLASPLSLLLLLCGTPPTVALRGASAGGGVARSADALTRRAVLASPVLALAARSAGAADSITYEELGLELRACRDGLECRVEKVVFTITSGETGDAIMGGVARPILGIPKDDPNNDSSPYKLAAKCRDAKVPYSFPFADVLAKYKSSKSPAPNIISAPVLGR
jgi:hypothetical protein